MPESKTSPDPQETQPTVSRRDLFHILGAVPAVAAVAGSAPAQNHKKHSGPDEHEVGGSWFYQLPEVFDPHQFKTVCVLCDLIIPRDEHSGSATEAGVPTFLDDWIAFRTREDGNEDLKAEIFGGLIWLDREANRLFEKDFADASRDQQKQILDRIAYPHKAEADDRPWAHFFSEFRSLTVSGFFSSKMGVAALPYLGNTLVVEWKGCDPKVWAILEDRMRNGYKGLLESKPWIS